jgi:hypothetical protein
MIYTVYVIWCTSSTYIFESQRKYKAKFCEIIEAQFNKKTFEIS